MTEPRAGRDITGVTLSVLFLAALIGMTFSILSPFLPALLWAAMVAISTWPLLLRIQARLKNRRELATAFMSVVLLLLFFVPLGMAISSIVENADTISEWGRSLASLRRPQPPAWLENAPVVGPKIALRWRVLIASDKDDLIARATPYVGTLVSWFVSQVGNFGMLFVQFLLTVVLSALLYLRGEAAAEIVLRFAHRLGGEKGEEVMILAAKAVRAVALGVVGTALAQSIVAGIGFGIVGAPQPVLLTALVFFFAVIQVGALPVMVPTIVWLFIEDRTGMAALLIIWTVLVTVMDNVLRPVLIRKGANLPFLLILAGVLGGLISFGIIGLFIGPVVLAISYTLLTAWIETPASKAA